MGVSDTGDIIKRFLRIRNRTEELVSSLETEDFVVQPMIDASPPRWHLGHTTWFFEQFLLGRRDGYTAVHPQYAYLFNSYYNSVGERTSRPARGMLTRPTVREIFDYRHQVNDRVCETLAHIDDEGAQVLELGLNHEQQHQELLLTDLKAVLFQAPLYPAWRDDAPFADHPSADHDDGFASFDSGIVQIGHEGDEFSFDNERPRHDALLHAFRLANDLVTNAMYREFMADGGYDNALLWLSDGWDWLQREGIRAPAYWVEHEGEWQNQTLYGLHPIEPLEPVTHVSYYEASAFAEWVGKRLPTEFEWEHAATTGTHARGLFQDNDCMHPRRCLRQPADGPRFLFGDVWEWTQSAYAAYPGFAPLAGGLGEYNAKFMANQFVVRGGSVATPRDHFRPTYRNFFHPDKRWQFTGIRLAEDA